LADADGLGTISYQWLADGQVISGATGAALIPVIVKVVVAKVSCFRLLFL
jgi:hypothetical protein